MSQLRQTWPGLGCQVTWTVKKHLVPAVQFPCWHLDPSPRPSREDLCLSLLSLAGCTLHSCKCAPEVQEGGLGRHRELLSQLDLRQQRGDALLADGWYSLLFASGCAASRCMRVSCCWDCSKRRRVSHGIHSKSPSAPFAPRGW